MLTKRAYFTATISGFADVKEHIEKKDIEKVIASSIRTIGLRVNKKELFIHKIHLPKQRTSI